MSCHVFGHCYGHGYRLGRGIGSGYGLGHCHCHGLGEGRIDQHDGSVVMGGAPDINNAGDIAFIASLTPAGNNQIEWGSGLFIAYGSLLFADGFESGDTDEWAVVIP